MKKLYFKITTVCIICFLLILAQISSVATVSAAKVKLCKKKLTLCVGDTYLLKLKGTSQKIKWSSSKKKIATVNKIGKITAKKEGKTTITATSKGKSYTCKVTVKKASKSTTPSLPEQTTTPVTPINTGNDTATTDETDTAEPSISKLSITAQKLYSHVLLTITNNNTCCLSTVEINYDFYTSEEEFLSYGTGTLLSMLPGETQYLSLDPSLETTDDIDLTYSELTVNIEEGNPLYQYDSTKEVSHKIQKDTEVDYTLSLTNSTSTYIEGSYIIFFYDKKKNLIDAYQNTFCINDSDSIEEYFTEPYYYDDDYNLITPADSYLFQSTAHTVTEK